MELAELCRISEKYAMEDRAARPKIVLEKRGLSYTRSIRKMGEKRPQRSRSKSLPSLAIHIPPKAFPNEPLQEIIKEQNSFAEDDTDCQDESVRIRQFSTTMKGLVKMGDLRKDSRRDSGYSSTSYRRNSSISISSACGSNYGRRESVFAELPSNRRNSTFASSYCTPVRRTSCITEREYKKLGNTFAFNSSQDSILDECPSEYQVLVFGASGVGKSAIINQFTTSEFLGASDVHTDSIEQRTSVSVILNKEESVMELIEENNPTIIEEPREYDIDAYMIVYSCADRNSFRAASQVLKRLKEETGSCKTVMIVANKVDLARKRQVNYDEGRSLAYSYNCKYIETSAALNHNVDELLAGVLSQIRLKQYGEYVRDNMIGQKKQRPQKGLTGALKTAFRGVFGKKQKISSCENLYEI
ncbi:GTP-binding protein REM 1-like [Mercenaria mercenaria]|uniref:GTP-binding protein REM 1-like n=1 Tax=Mercenaria mercenaria TaxID=6596 RepID=UPI00234E5329|nr:GTP-binding protein REM 1-like [Mercenaria mercenaria]